MKYNFLHSLGRVTCAGRNGCPGDYLHHEDDEIEGFKKRLNERLAPVGSQFSGEGVRMKYNFLHSLGRVTCAGRNGYMKVSKLGRHHCARVSLISQSSLTPSPEN
jgi:hypothetical protein